MTAKAHYFRIGLFIILGVLLTVVGIVVLKAGSLFEKREIMETYFDESVQGLEVGAPIKHRGVKVGTVKKIGFVRNIYRDQLTTEDRIRFGSYVVVRVAVHEVFPGLKGDEMETALKAAIDEGLRIRLATQGITGVVHLEADQVDPREYPPLPVAWTPEYFYIPSAPSPIKVIGDTINNIAKDLDQANFHKVTADLDELLRSTKQLIDETHMAQLSRQAAETLTEFQETVRDAKRLLANPEIKRILADAAAAAGSAKRTVAEVGETTRRLSQASETLPATLARLERTLRRVDRLVEMKDQDLAQTIENLRQISENVRDLTNEVKRYPSLLAFGDPPPRKERGTKP
jgi:phospholipid/cholesterol/gamma-HCH transport system substrate-binding protein/paraquat-inducible protein B